MRNFVQCFECEKSRVLGELFPNGILAIKRHTGSFDMNNYTLLMGTQYIIICGKCRGTILITVERRKDESTVFGTKWISGKPSNGTSQEYGLGSGWDQPYAFGTN